MKKLCKRKNQKGKTNATDDIELGRRQTFSKDQTTQGQDGLTKHEK